MGLEIHLFESDSINGYIPDPKNKKFFIAKEFVDVPSRFPDNINNRRYLYSPSNGAGPNAVLKSVGLPTLYDIFGVDRRINYPLDFKKDDLNLKTALYKTRNARLRLKRIVDERPYRALEVSAASLRPYSAPDSSSEALEIFYAEKARWGTQHNLFNSYITDIAHFFLQEPLQVVALIPTGRKSGIDSIFVVYVDTSMKWYIEFLYIVEEFIQEALFLDYPIVKWRNHRD